jgi:mono/diheme cytochrome c family protein
MRFNRSILLTACAVAVAIAAAAHAETGTPGPDAAPAQGAAPAQRATRPSGATPLNVERLFATSCGWCHQNGGRTAGRGPKLAGTDKSDQEIIRQIKAGKPPGMPSFGRSFNDEQIGAIVAYIRGLKDEP